ncbi:tail fiber assembly protein [Pseudomonas sp. CFBP 5748]
MDVSMAIEWLVPAAQYFGSLTDNTRDSFEMLSWNDERPKPTWENVEFAWEESQKPNVSDLADKALARRDELLVAAALRIAPLQDAVDLGDETPEEETYLKQWKQYRVALNRISQQPDFPMDIKWPVASN